jgi:hypothetical protein
MRFGLSGHLVIWLIGYLIAICPADRGFSMPRLFNNQITR